MNQIEQNKQRSITDRFAALFQGRTDSWGAVHGESIKKPVVQKSYFLHLVEKASLGIYPLLDDGTCRFGAIDIDKDDRELVLRLREEFWSLGLKSEFVERSRSKGYHIWVFFTEAVKAEKVRHILSTVVDKVGEPLEVFPKQEILREGEVGNYINLPYFGGLEKTLERRVIVDPLTFKPVPLEEFLSKAERSLITMDVLEAILEELPPISERSSATSEKPENIPDVDVHTLNISGKVKALILGKFIKGENGSIKVSDPAAGETSTYPSRSEADEAIISSLLRKGYKEDTIFGVFEKYPTTGKYKEKDRRKDNYLTRSITNAMRFIEVSERENTLDNTYTPSFKGKGITISVPSSVFGDGRIVEMLYDPKEKETRFAVFKEGELSYEKNITLKSGVTLVPYSPRNNLIKNNTVLFPSEVEDYGTEADLLGEIKSFIHRYVDLSPLYEKIATYYALFSWIYDDFNELPYLRVIGDAGSGKTRFLLIVGSLCYKPIFASGASTVSPLFRIIDIFKGTLIIDEGDFRMSDEKSEVVKILNNGNAQGFPILRSEPTPGREREFNPRSYSVFGPKIIATRGFFEDKALETRCITEEMGQRKLRNDIPINLNDEYKAEAQKLRGKLAMFRFRNLGKKKIDPSLVDRSIEPRLNQVFVPLLSVIEDASARSGLMSVARMYNKQIVAERGMETEAQVLEVIQELLHSRGKDHNALYIKQVTRRFIENYGEDYERRITPKWIGTVLRKKLKLRTERKMDGFAVSPSEIEKLHHLFEKYGLVDESENHEHYEHTD